MRKAWLRSSSRSETPRAPGEAGAERTARPAARAGRARRRRVPRARSSSAPAASAPSSSSAGSPPSRAPSLAQWLAHLAGRRVQLPQRAVLGGQQPLLGDVAHVLMRLPRRSRRVAGALNNEPHACRGHVTSEAILQPSPTRCSSIVSRDGARPWAALSTWAVASSPLTSILPIVSVGALHVAEALAERDLARAAPPPRPSRPVAGRAAGRTAADSPWPRWPSPKASTAACTCSVSDGPPPHPDRRRDHQERRAGGARVGA